MKPEFEPIEIFFDYDSHDQWRQLSIEKSNVRKDILSNLPSGLCLEQLPPPIDIIANLVNTQEMRETIAQYESIPIEMDWFTGKVEQPNFSIYTRNEKQNELTYTLDKLINQVNNLRAMGCEIYISHLIDALNGAIYYDLESHTIDVNHKFILKCQ